MRRIARHGLALTVTSVLGVACSQSTDSGETVTVSTLFPTHLPPTATLENGPATVEIDGSGFGSDAVASFELNGAPDPGVQVDSTVYVSSAQVVAFVTVASNAKRAKYTPIVTRTRSRKRGIGTETFEVRLDPVFKVEIRPASANLSLGTSFNLAARVRTGDASYQPIVTDRVVTWKSADINTVSVDQTGLVTGIAQGTTTITATAEGVTGTAPVTVGPQPTISPIASITSGYKTTCALNTSGVAFCWGDGGVGQLGNGNLAAASSPVTVSGLTFSAISPAIFHTCGVAIGGAAYCWGRNDPGGALGNGSLDDAARPVAVSGGLQFTSIATGFEYTCGLVASGDAYCWGEGDFGVLGNGTNAVSTVPVPVSGGHKFAALTGGFGHACGIDTSGVTWCWGRNLSGELGDGTTNNANVPVRVSGGIVFASLTAGERLTCGLTQNGTAYCWGWDGFGQLGDGKSGAGTNRGNPAPVSGGLAFVSITAGNIHVCGVTNTGAVYCWGDNSHGELGDGTLVAKTVPVAVSGGLSFSAITSGLYLTCGLTSTDVAYCWGYGTLGQLGNGATADTNVPTKVGGQP